MLLLEDQRDWVSEGDLVHLVIEAAESMDCRAFG
jgi:hypothetical protein